MKKKNQQGSLVMILIPVVTVVLLIAIVAVFWTTMHKKPTTKTQTTNASADEPLTSGNANGDLSKDVQILSAGDKRSSGYLSSTNTALNDQSGPVLND